MFGKCILLNTLCLIFYTRTNALIIIIIIIIKNFFQLPVLVSQLITTEIWRDKIFRELIAIQFEPRVTFSIYIIVC